MFKRKHIPARPGRQSDTYWQQRKPNGEKPVYSTALATVPQFNSK